MTETEKDAARRAAEKRSAAREKDREKRKRKKAARATKPLQTPTDRRGSTSDRARTRGYLSAVADERGRRAAKPVRRLQPTALGAGYRDQYDDVGESNTHMKSSTGKGANVDENFNKSTNGSRTEYGSVGKSGTEESTGGTRLADASSTSTSPSITTDTAGSEYKSTSTRPRSSTDNPESGTADSGCTTKESGTYSEPVNHDGRGESTNSSGRKPKSVHTRSSNGDAHELSVPGRNLATLPKESQKQFILQGSIGSIRVRILVDTGATISFVSSKLIPRLVPRPEVLKSELSIIMGNGSAQDTDHYVAVDLVLLETAFWAKLHLLELPPTFDVIVGTDWLTAHNVQYVCRHRVTKGRMDKRRG